MDRIEKTTQLALPLVSCGFQLRFDYRAVNKIGRAVGGETTTLSRGAIFLKDDLANLGGKWDDKAAGVQCMPAARTDELVTARKEKHIRAAEVSAERSSEPTLF